ncbi:hypothetical protein [Xanthomonas albilineans]|nr:hypothetical protein [Xanthomonas albilineans]
MAHQPITPWWKLPIEVAEEVAAVTKALTERLASLAVELNDKAVKAAERRVAEVIRTAGEQREQSERELADASQTVEDLESKLDETKAEAEVLQSKLVDVQAAHQAQAVELAERDQARADLATVKAKAEVAEQVAKAAAQEHATTLAERDAACAESRPRPKLPSKHSRNSRNSARPLRPRRTGRPNATPSPRQSAMRRLKQPQMLAKTRPNWLANWRRCRLRMQHYWRVLRRRRPGTFRRPARRVGLRKKDDADRTSPMLCVSACGASAVMNVQIQQADRRNEYREGPADRHRHQFHEQHEDGVHEEDVAAHDVADDALIDEAGVRVEQRVHGEQGIGAERYRMGRGAVTQREQDKRREDQAEEELTNIVLARQAAEGLCDDRMHSVFPFCWQHRVCRGIRLTKV